MYIQFRTRQNLHILHRFCKSHVKKIGFQRFQSYNDLNTAKAVTVFFFFFFFLELCNSRLFWVWNMTHITCHFFSIDIVSLKFCFWVVPKIMIHSPLFSLSISMANFWSFLLWIVKKLYLSRSSSKVHLWLLYTILRVFDDFRFYCNTRFSWITCS